MSGPFTDEYWKVACNDIETLEKMGDCGVIDRTDDINSIGSTYNFRIKRFPDGLINKFKGRLFDSEYQQLEGVNFFKTYALVVQ